MKTNTCCFFGHRTINITAELKSDLNGIIEKLITEHNVDTFLFGSKSQFNTLCYEQVTKWKEKYPNIKRVYVRAEFAEISKSYEEYLLESYEDTYYPEKLMGAGRAVYERNCIMIDQSHYCVVYSREDYKPQKRKSGTKLALAYALHKGKYIILLP